jgi:hypothetical protein
MKASLAEIEHGRVLEGHLASKQGDNHGLFIIQEKDEATGAIVMVTNLIWDSGDVTGWEHLIIATKVATPEGPKQVMQLPAFINQCKNLFWDNHETVVQFCNDELPLGKNNVTHLWKSKRQDYALPPVALHTPPQVPADWPDCLKRLAAIQQGGGIVAVIDTESVYNKEMAIEAGLDESQLLVYLAKSNEDAGKVFDKFIESGCIAAVVTNGFLQILIAPKLVQKSPQIPDNIVRGDFTSEEEKPATEPSLPSETASQQETTDQTPA